MWKPARRLCAFDRTNWIAHLLAAPSANWREAAEKARYLLNLFASSMAGQDPRRQKLIAAALDDFERLGRE